MRTIHKYTLELARQQEILMPENAVALSVQMQNGQPCLWVAVDDQLPKRKLVVRMYGTGFELDLNIGRHLGTVQLDNGLVFHYFGAAE